PNSRAMVANPEKSSSVPHPPAGFATTRWSLVHAAADPASPQAQQAIAVLAQTDWHPLYALIPRQGHCAEDAQDLTQEFFTRLLAKNTFGAAEQDRGRFRSFLLVACKHFLANEYDRARAKKRGGDRRVVAIDLGDAESRFSLEPV